MCKVSECLKIDGNKEKLIKRISQRTKINPETGCIEWTARSRTSFGYGQIGLKGFASLRVHRIVWTIANGEIPENLLIMHSCDNPLCCNLEHLSLGTHKDNTTDMWTKGRQSEPPIHKALEEYRERNPGKFRGEDNATSKLKEFQVLEILTSPESPKYFCEKFNISKHTISLIRKRKIWKHVEVPSEY